MIDGARAATATASSRRAAAVKANREYELIVRKGGRGPALLAAPDRLDHVEIVEIAIGRGGAVLGHRAGADRAARARPARRPRPARRDRFPRQVAALAERVESRPRSRATVHAQWRTSRRRRPGASFPTADAAREWLEAMMLIRRFEERAGEMYAKAKVGGFLHLAIGEEATIVGAVRAMRDDGLPDLHLPLARPRALARRRPRRGHGRAVRPRGRRLEGPRRLDAHVRPRAALHGRLRDRRRQPPAGRRHGPRLGLPGHRRRDRLRVRRRRRQPGHVRRDAQPRRAVGPAGRVHGHQQPVRHGHLDRAPLRGDRPAPPRRRLRRAGHALRRHGRRRHPSRHAARRSGARARTASRSSSRPSPTASADTRWPTRRSTAPRSRSRSGASATRSPTSPTAS